MPDMRLASCLGLASVVYDMVTKENPDLGDCGDDDWYGRNSAFDMAVREGHLDVMLILFYQGELRYSTKKNTYKALFEHSQDSEPGSGTLEHIPNEGHHRFCHSCGKEPLRICHDEQAPQ